MKRKFLIFIFIIFLVFIFSYCLKDVYLAKTIKQLNFAGFDKYWKAYLHANLNYSSELNIYPTRDDFEIPSEINIEIIVNNKQVYTNKLEYIKDPNGFLLGKYTIDLNSHDYFNYGTKEVVIILKYNNEIVTIPMKMRTD